jgi:PRTRC genetic system ThiF family protein
MDGFMLPQTWTERRVNVVLAGAGGSGSELLDGLVRIDRALRALGHPGLSIRVFDADEVSVPNTIRQRWWRADVGHNKAELLAHRYAMFGGCEIQGYADALTAETLRDAMTYPGVDVFITCVDKATVRGRIGRFFAELSECEAPLETLWLDLGNGANDGQVVLGHLCGWRGDDRRLPNVLDLYPELSTDADALDADDTPSCSAAEALAAQDLFIGRVLAAHAADLLWQLLRRGRIDSHGCFVTPGQVLALKIHPDTRASFGLMPQTVRKAA